MFKGTVFSQLLASAFGFGQMLFLKGQHIHSTRVKWSPGQEYMTLSTYRQQNIMV